MDPHRQDKLEIILGLRDMLYSEQRLDQALNGYRPVFHSLRDAHPDAVLGVVTEMGLEGTGGVVAIVAGFADGDARLFWTGGRGIMGDLDSYPSIAEAAKLLVKVAQLLVATLPREINRELPAPGMVRFAMLTPGGVYVAEEKDADLRKSDHHLYVLYDAMQGLLTELRLLDEQARKRQQEEPQA